MVRLTLITRFNGIVCFTLGISLLLACGKPKPTPPESDAIYDLTQILSYNDQFRTYSWQFEGTKGFNIQGSGCQITTFVFDSPDDFMELQIRDQAGIVPGQTLTYALEHSLNGARQDFWDIILSNPISSTTLKQNFDLPFKLNPSAGEYTWRRSGGAVGGLYTFGTTDRRMTVSIRLYLKARISGQITGTCRDEK
jgi:hypothetical protein